MDAVACWHEPRADRGRDPSNISKAYTPDSIWRNRSSFVQGTAAIEALLTEKWQKEKSYRLRKELFAFTENKIAVQFWYEYQDAHDGMKWKRCYGLEDWTFAEDGRMRKRQMSGNDIEISESGKDRSAMGNGSSTKLFQNGGSWTASTSTRSTSARPTGDGVG